MTIYYHKYFDKNFRKLPLKIQERTLTRIELFNSNPNSKLLNNHALAGKYYGSRSIDISGDYRAIYEPITESIVLFTNIGTHSQLY